VLAETLSGFVHYESKKVSKHGTEKNCSRKLKPGNQISVVKLHQDAPNGMSNFANFQRVMIPDRHVLRSLPRKKAKDIEKIQIRKK